MGNNSFYDNENDNSIIEDILNLNINKIVITEQQKILIDLIVEKKLIPSILNEEKIIGEHMIIARSDLISDLFLSQYISIIRN